MLACAVAHAQQSPKDLPSRYLRFHYFGRADLLAGEVDPTLRAQIREGMTTRELIVAPFSTSELIEYRGPDRIVFFREVEVDRIKQRKDLGEFTLPPDRPGLLVLVTRRPGGGEFPFVFYPVDFWGPDVPEGSVRVLNLANAQIAVRLNGNDATIESRAGATVRMGQLGELLPLRLAVNIAGADDTWIPVMSRFLAPPTANRGFFLVYQAGPEPADIGIELFFELPMPPPPDSPQGAAPTR